VATAFGTRAGIVGRRRSNAPAPARICHLTKAGVAVHDVAVLAHGDAVTARVAHGRSTRAWNRCTQNDRQAAKTFEQKLARIDAIVKELEGGTVELQRATELFKEGKMLARDCEAL